jgi:hypothetical protein
VSIVAHTLQQAGLINYRRGHIRIEKPEELRHTACECYGTVRMRYDALRGMSAPDDTRSYAFSGAVVQAGRH